MGTFFAICMGLAMLAVLGSLFVGVFSMTRGGAADHQRSQRAMRMRVIMQAVALGFFVLAILSYQK